MKRKEGRKMKMIEEKAAEEIKKVIRPRRRR
jgi:hypothetical protein